MASTLAATPQQVGVTDEAIGALGETATLHTLIDALEERLFGPEPKDAGESRAGNDYRPAVREAVRTTHHRLMSGNDRIRSIIDRL